MTTYEPCRDHTEIHDHRGWCLACELEAVRADRKRLLAENAELWQRLTAVAQHQHLTPCQPLRVVSRKSMAGD